MTGPIQSRIGMGLAPESHIQRAITWYSDLFGMAVAETSHKGTIHDVQIPGATGLILDARRDPEANLLMVCQRSM